MREIFHGTYQRPPANPGVIEPSFDEGELRVAIGRMKKKKASDAKGLVAELLHNSPPEFRSTVLKLCNDVLAHGIVPEERTETDSFQIVGEDGKCQNSFGLHANCMLAVFVLANSFPVWFWARLKMPWSMHNQKSNMVSGLVVASRSMWLLPTLSSGKRLP